MAQDHDQFMRMALEEADKAGSEGNIAVGSVIIMDDTVVAKGRNLVNSTLDVTTFTAAWYLSSVSPGTVDEIQECFAFQEPS